MRSPLRNPADYEFVDHVGRYLLEVLKEKAGLMPFPLQDRYELWLLDTAFDLPLALIGSVCQRGDIDEAPPLRWRAGIHAEEHFRVLPALDEALRGEKPARRLERVVNGAAGPRLRAQWFYRSEKGCGQALVGIHTEPPLDGRVLPPEAFPEQQLRSHWPDETEQTLVRAYLDWQSPLAADAAAHERRHARPSGAGDAPGREPHLAPQGDGQRPYRGGTGGGEPALRRR
jgi:hypothetical protein